LQGREITAAHDYERPSVEVLHLTRNLTPADVVAAVTARPLNA
jgi:hypothetical protein